LASLLLAVLGCAAVTGSRSTARFAWLFGVLALCSPLLAPSSAVAVRTLLAAAATVVLGRGLDLTRRSDGLSFWGRAWLLVALFDVRAAQRVRPRFDRREALWLLLHLTALGLGGLVVFGLAPRLDGALAWITRWGAGLIACYGIVESVQSVLLLGYRGLGIELPRLNDFPIRSTTLAEFWGRRWNRAVSGWLNDYLFFPLARRRHPVLGIIAAFAGSCALHFWFAWAPLDLLAGLSMASFFAVHGAAMLLERTLVVSSWSLAARRSWTAAWIVVSCPLFIEPALRILAGFSPG
jgi:hypothetical protein